MQLNVLNKEGQQTGRTVELPDEIFGTEPNDHVIWLSVKQHLAAQRQGTHKVKTRLEVKGSSRKLHRQKGTGGSRKGNIRNPLFRGGGTIFGPKPRDYSFKLNRKVKDLAKVSALAHKAKENSILVLEDLQPETPRTQDFVKVLKNLQINVDGKRTLFVTPEYNDVLYRSMRNVPTVLGALLSDINTYDIMNSHYLVFSESAAKIFAQSGEATGENNNDVQAAAGEAPAAQA
ncbi:50S ribosomal protein L4 [Compostibacter hankyongensis]|uniref:Large ribosomal subunit protein uL4 n=1 Tax=Compostibacter hankyongensis TaxID=1007089 RepID=A0ABP8GAP6_9BACT